MFQQIYSQRRKFLLAGTALATMTVGALVSPNESHALERWLRVHNQTSTSLCEVYISNVSAGWQEDRIGSCIEPGYYRTINPGRQDGY